MWFIFKGLGFRTAKETKTAFQYAALIALSIIDSGETNKSKAKKKTKTKTRKEKENQRINALYSNVLFVKKKNWKEQSQF